MVLAMTKPFKCHTQGCDGYTDEAPGWCDKCIKLSKNLICLSDRPIYLVCSFATSRALAPRYLGLLVVPDKHCPDDEVYFIGDEYLGNLGFAIGALSIE